MKIKETFKNHLIRSIRKPNVNKIDLLIIRKTRVLYTQEIRICFKCDTVKQMEIPFNCEIIIFPFLIAIKCISKSITLI